MFEHKESAMDDKLQKKIIRQLRGIRMTLTLLFIVVLAGFALLGFFVFKTSGLVTDAQDQLKTLDTQVNSASDLKNTACSSGLMSESTLCTN